MMDFFPTLNSVYVMIGSMVFGAAGGLLGCFAVLRKQGLLGDAVAHTALPGIAVAFLILQSKFLPGLLLGALIAGLIGAYLIHYIVKNTKIKMDTAMASILSIFFGLGILLLTYIQKLPLASQSGLNSFIFGNAASLLRQDVIWMVIIFVAIILLVTIFWKELKLFTFNAEFAQVLGFKRGYLEFLFMTVFVTAILISLQAVGVVLTAALFITPAASALLWTKRLLSATVLSTFFGMISGTIGAFVSSLAPHMPTGPIIVLIITAIFLFSLFFAPKSGILSRYFAHRKYSAKVSRENVLGRLYRNLEEHQDSYATEFSRSILSKLQKSRLIEIRDEIITLTQSGRKESKSVIEKHRLWEAYLVNRLNIAPDHVHRDAEEIEHVLTDEMKLKLRKLLKNPKFDPHGKPIE